MQKKHAELLIHLASDFGQIVAIDLSISTASSGVYQSLRCALAGEQQLQISSTELQPAEKKVPSKKIGTAGREAKSQPPISHFNAFFLWNLVLICSNMLIIIYVIIYIYAKGN